MLRFILFFTFCFSLLTNDFFKKSQKWSVQFNPTSKNFIQLNVDNQQSTKKFTLLLKKKNKKTKHIFSLITNSNWWYLKKLNEKIYTRYIPYSINFDFFPNAYIYLFANRPQFFNKNKEKVLGEKVLETKSFISYQQDFSLEGKDKFYNNLRKLNQHKLKYNYSKNIEDTEQAIEQKVLSLLHKQESLVVKENNILKKLSLGKELFVYITDIKKSKEKIEIPKQFKSIEFNTKKFYFANELDLKNQRVCAKIFDKNNIYRFPTKGLNPRILNYDSKKKKVLLGVQSLPNYNSSVVEFDLSTLAQKNIFSFPQADLLIEYAQYINNKKELLIITHNKLTAKKGLFIIQNGRIIKKIDLKNNFSQFRVLNSSSLLYLEKSNMGNNLIQFNIKTQTHKTLLKDIDIYNYLNRIVNYKDKLGNWYIYQIKDKKSKRILDYNDDIIKIFKEKDYTITIEKSSTSPKYFLEFNGEYQSIESFNRLFLEIYYFN